MASLQPSLNQCDENYTAQIRKNLRTFHLNLDLGKWENIEKGLAPDYYWNYDGTAIFTPAAGKAALQYVAGTLLGGVNANDIYNIVDGNRGAILFRIAGKQGADFFGVPLQSPGSYDVRSAERFVFHADGLAREVTTVTPIGVMKDQMRGADVAFSPPETSLRQGAQKTLSFLELTRKNMASLHLNLLSGREAANELLAVQDVENDENGTITCGRDAFAKLVSAHNVGLGSFPVKSFHDVDILADGNQGAIEYIWTGSQESDYKDIPVKEGAKVKVRGMLFFEFNELGLIEKAVSVYDEGVVEATLSNPGVYTYL